MTITIYNNHHIFYIYIPIITISVMNIDMTRPSSTNWRLQKLLQQIWFFRVPRGDRSLNPSEQPDRSSHDAESQLTWLVAQPLISYSYCSYYIVQAFLFNESWPKNSKSGIFQRLSHCSPQPLSPSSKTNPLRSLERPCVAGKALPSGERLQFAMERSTIFNGKNPLEHGGFNRKTIGKP